MLAMITDKDAWPFFALVGAMALVTIPLIVMIAYQHVTDARRRTVLDRLSLLIECADGTTTVRDLRPRPLLATARTVRA